MLEFIWDAIGKWRLADSEAKLSLNSSKVTQKIELLSPYHAFRILGVWIAPNGYSINQTIY